MNKQTGDGSIEWRTEARARLLIPGDGGVVLLLAVAGAALLVVPAHPQRAHHRVLGAHRRALHLLSGLETDVEISASSTASARSSKLNCVHDACDRCASQWRG